MGMILECRAVAPDLAEGDRARSRGLLVASVSINSVGADAILAPLVTGPLSGIDLAAPGPAGVLIGRQDFADLLAWLAGSGVDPNLANAIDDAVEEALAQHAALWIGFA